MSELAILRDQNDLVLSQADVARPLSVRERQAQINIIQELMRNNMKEKTHYGVVPGAKKPSLWKPGAELIAMTLRIAIDNEPTELSGADDIRYRVRAVAKSQSDGHFLGAAYGECWSLESKYMWREAIVQKEWDETPVDRRRIKYEKTNTREGYAEVHQVRTHAPDVVNTILKMGQKRADIAVILMVTAASDIFTQDLEDLPREIAEAINAEDRAGAVDVPGEQPKRASESAKPDVKPPAGVGLFVTSTRIGKSVKEERDKEGNVTTKGWTLYRLKFSDGVERATFSDTVYHDAVKACENGNPVAFDGEESPKGYTIKTLEILAK